MDTSKHRSGFVSIIGNPNVGKSTLMNALTGKQLAITTPKAQTTRHRILGIVNSSDSQMILSDTPGIIKPAYEMQNAMMGFVKESLVDADVLVYMTTPTERESKDSELLKKVQNFKNPLVVLVNKIDLTDDVTLEKSVAHWRSVFPKARVYPIAAKTGFFIPELLTILTTLLPPFPPYFPKDQLTDKPERFFVNEAIREQILKYYDKEIPYSVAVITEQFLEDSKIIRIDSVIYVERESQKGILIGHKGSSLKKVGIGARKSLEAFFGKKVHLKVYVKVSKNWRKDSTKLKHFGYSN